MKILIVSQHYYPENFRINDISRELVRLGHEVTVLCGYPNYPQGEIYDGYRGKEGKKRKKENIDGVKVIRCYEHPRKKNHIHLFLNYYSACISMVFRALQMKEKFDCVFINQLAPVMQARAGIAYAKKNKVPCMLYCYDLWPDNLSAGGIQKGSFIYNLYYLVSNRIYRNVDKILVTSKRFIPYFTEFHHIAPDLVSYLPQYCEDLFAIDKQQQHNKQYNLLFAGNVGKLQSVETIIQAAALLKDDDVLFHIVGDGSSLVACKELAIEKELENVVFYGKRDISEMPKFYAMADAMLVTLIKDEIISNTLPGKIQSYMCAGKPIIAAINGEGADIIKEADCGLCCEAENAEGLANIIREFVASGNKGYGENARCYYEQHFSKELFFNKLLFEFDNVKIRCR